MLNVNPDSSISVTHEGPITQKNVSNCDKHSVSGMAYSFKIVLSNSTLIICAVLKTSTVNVVVT